MANPELITLKIPWNFSNEQIKTFVRLWKYFFGWLTCWGDQSVWLLTRFCATISLIYKNLGEYYFTEVFPISSTCSRLLFRNCVSLSAYRWMEWAFDYSINVSAAPRLLVLLEYWAEDCELKRGAHVLKTDLSSVALMLIVINCRRHAGLKNHSTNHSFMSSQQPSSNQSLQSCLWRQLAHGNIVFIQGDFQVEKLPVKI